MAWVSFTTIQTDLVNLLTTEVTAAQMVKAEADARDYAYHNMPLIDVRIRDSANEVRSGRDYYVFVTYEVQVTCHDLSGFDEAATLRDTLMASAIDAVRNNADFSASIQTSRIGAVEFTNAKDENTGAFMAAATFEVITETYVDK